MIMKILDFSLPYHSDDSKIIGAGIMPFAIKDRRVYVLLGQEDSDGRFGVFGGRMKPGCDEQETAICEFHEETMGAVLDRNLVTKLLAMRMYTLKFTGAAGVNRFFITYMLRIPWDPSLPEKFQRQRSALLHGDFTNVPDAFDEKTCRVKYDFVEKRSVAWFPFDELAGIALRSRWNHPVIGMDGTPMFRRPFLAGLNNLVQYFNVPLFLKDLAWCDS
ncbi:hypothetical protein GHT06_003849 [Daphnia sinensis]|uniref:Nudix hydrolase domain-containing protein n=1 Tax=Daphnia sinensis TaxID=1820382 RepID=A0AAD5L2E5_9CRUS|nr:hypothetical protein GHT06_003849 [Daphnia sinensis]